MALWMPAQQTLLERMGVALRDTAKLANVTIEIHSVPEDQFRAAPRQMTINNFSARTTPDTMLYEWYHSTGSWNMSNWHYKNPEIDQILLIDGEIPHVGEMRDGEGRDVRITRNPFRSSGVIFASAPWRVRNA